MVRIIPVHRNVLGWKDDDMGNGSLANSAHSCLSSSDLEGVNICVLRARC